MTLRFNRIAFEGENGSGAGASGASTTGATGGTTATTTAASGGATTTANAGATGTTTTAAAVTKPWHETIGHEGIRGVASSFKSEQEFYDALGLEIDDGKSDWRSGITDPALLEQAKRFDSVEALVRGNVDMRTKLSSAVVRPGALPANATEAQKAAHAEATAAFRKSMGVPETPEGYKFPDIAPELMNDQVKATREAWAKRFHENGVPAELAFALTKALYDDGIAARTAQQAADKKFAEQAEAALRQKWQGQEYDRNRAFGNRGAEEFAKKAGVDFEDLRHIELKDGRYLLDDPRMIQIFATIGREMGEGTLGPISESDRSGVETQISDVRKQIAAAQAAGNGTEANRLYLKEQDLLGKLGNKSIVGSMGRAA